MTADGTRRWSLKGYTPTLTLGDWEAALIFHT